MQLLDIYRVNAVSDPGLPRHWATQGGGPTSDWLRNLRGTELAPVRRIGTEKETFGLGHLRMAAAQAFVHLGRRGYLDAIPRACPF